jgi:hypothetical protein
MRTGRASSAQADKSLGARSTSRPLLLCRRVLPPTFRFAERLAADDRRFAAPADLWTPLRPGDPLTGRDGQALAVVGRLRPEAGIGEAQDEAHAYAERAAKRFPESDGGYGMKVVLLRDQVFGRRQARLTLWVGVCFLAWVAAGQPPGCRLVHGSLGSWAGATLAGLRAPAGVIGVLFSTPVASQASCSPGRSRLLASVSPLRFLSPALPEQVTGPQDYWAS